MTAFSIGEIVSVEFPFTDMKRQKRRPGVVLAVDQQDLLLARVTTQQPRDGSDVLIAGWSTAGLPRPSTVRLRKLVSIDHRLVHHVIGRLSEADCASLAEAIERLGHEISSHLRRSNA